MYNFCIPLVYKILNPISKKFNFFRVILISAHLWRVGGRALCVEAAAEAVAGALAAVAVELVHVEGRRADAGAPLALLVLLGGNFN